MFPACTRVSRPAFLLFVGVLLFSGRVARSQDSDTGDSKADQREPFELSEDVRVLLEPLFRSIVKAKVSRANVKLSAETVENGHVIKTDESSYQIASKAPDQYTIYHKSNDDPARIFHDGRTMAVAMSTEAYCVLPGGLSCRDLVTDVPIDLGPYPEPILALTIAGAEPARTFTSGMRDVTLIGDTRFRGRMDSIRIRGQQADGVLWDLWLTKEEPVRPLRLLVNLTPMMLATGQVAESSNFEYSLRYDFLSWRVTGEIDENLFSFRPTAGARRFKSMEDYKRTKAEEKREHPLLNQPAPELELVSIQGDKFDLNSMRGKTIVLEFWSTYCNACLQQIPYVDATVKEAGSDVVAFGVNSGENPAMVRGFSGDLDWSLTLIQDADSQLTKTFDVATLPLTVVIDPSGTVRDVIKAGLPPQQFQQRLTDAITKARDTKSLASTP